MTAADPGLPIKVNVGLMATEHYDQPEAWATLMEYVNLGFSFVFLLEAGLKLHSMGWATYSESNSNLFDFFLVTNPNRTLRSIPFSCCVLHQSTSSLRC